jgi:hypothetical protein
LLKAFPQAIKGYSGTPMDTLVQLRPFREWAPGGRVSQMPTTFGKGMRAVFGGAFQAVDTERGKAARGAELRAEAQKIRAQINRAFGHSGPMGHICDDTVLDGQ